MLLALSSVCQMTLGIEVFIISSQDWGKRIIVVKLCMAFESGPEWLEELFSAGYYLALIQCSVFSRNRLDNGRCSPAIWISKLFVELILRVSR